jgi:hypothetical protein
LPRGDAITDVLTILYRGAQIATSIVEKAHSLPVQIGYAIAAGVFGLLS